MKNQKRSKKSSSSIIHLPDEVVMEILKRVPVIDVLRFCRVCQRWKELISTQHFKDMHVKSCSPSMVVVDTEDRSDRRSDLFLLQNFWDTEPKRLTIKKLLVPSSSLIFTYEGLIVFEDYISRRDFIFNPLSGEKFTISHQVGSKFSIIGMYFSALINKYCVLLGSFWRRNAHFKILTLGVEQSFRDLKPPSATLSIKKLRFPSMVIDDAALYWLRWLEGSCEEAIVAFDTKNEEFSLMPHPGCTKSCRKCAHSNMYIVKISGCLSCVRLKGKKSFIVNIWTLKDSSVNRVWVKTHRVSFGNLDGLLPANCIEEYVMFEVLTVEDAELLLLVRHRFGKIDRRLYACNLNNGTVRKIGSSYPYTYTYQFRMIVPSLAFPQI